METEFKELYDKVELLYKLNKAATLFVETFAPMKEAWDETLKIKEETDTILADFKNDLYSSPHFSKN